MLINKTISILPHLYRFILNICQLSLHLQVRSWLKCCCSAMTNGYSFGALEGNSTGCSPRFRPVFRDPGATHETAGYTTIDTTLVNMFDNSVTALLGCCFKWEATGYCHGMTKLVKLVKVHRKDQSVNKNAILASFVCFFNFPDRNLIILYKITCKLPFCVR